MEIPPHLRPPDTAARKRAVGESTPRSTPVSVSASRSDAVEASPDREAVARYVALAQQAGTDPAKLAELKQHIADGTYTATPDELAQGLLGDGPAA